MRQRLVAILAVVVALLGPAPAFAAPQEAVLNKEGYWGIDVDNGACAASMTLQGGAVFLLRAVDGQVTFALFGRTPLQRGKAGRVETEAYGFDFRPSYSDTATSLFFDGELDARALAALRLAREVRILAGGRPVAAMTFQGTGFEGALDGVVACSKGESGWWGKGVGAPQVAKAPEPEPALNKEGYWVVAASDRPGVCTAAVKVDEKLAFVLVGADGQIGFGLGSDDPLRRGRKGRFETDAYSFDFKPAYESPTSLYSEDVLDSQALFALRRATGVRINVDGREVVSVNLEGTGHAQVLADLTACSTGERGWWGEGAKEP